ncbi:MAG: UDP-N-acetylmuramate--L-alanine ligase [Alphaproteobacteria bacterium]|nr:UDP-N-acetylmuramate--L-alanine ligase [Alphaproteobacteria bacterium]
MKALPLSIGVIHFVGIGGIGMSGIAEILHTQGYTVRGSDLAEGANVKRLRDLGIAVAIGHRAENVEGAQVVVVSSAVKPDNPEVKAARAAFIPVVRRAEMLGELMRLKWSIGIAGTHGKTTTTSLVHQVLETADLDPTVINGGIINAYGSNAKLGKGDWMVVETDESDGSFLKLPATVAIVTNIDPEHLDFWGSYDKALAGFDSFVSNIPFYGFAVLCIDHPAVQGMIARITDRRVITYGFSPQAEIRAENLRMGPEGARFDVTIQTRGTTPRKVRDFSTRMVGKHNVQNACAAIAVGNEMGIDDEVMKKALAEFAGVKRRFTLTGESHGVRVIDDYGHHPVEIDCVLKAARGATRGGVIAVVQPHRFTRLKSLFEEFCTCFNDADAVIVANVYPAGEDPIPGADRDALVQGLRAHGHRKVVALDDPKQLAGIVVGMAKPGDLVVCLGAGSITAWANALPGDLDRAYAQTPSVQPQGNGANAPIRRMGA